jgi:hypothetical protein
MTDPGMADATYVGPMTPELVEQILDKVGGGGTRVCGWRGEAARGGGDIRWKVGGFCKGLTERAGREGGGAACEMVVVVVVAVVCRSEGMAQGSTGGGS